MSTQEPTAYPASSSFKKEYLRDGLHVALIPISDELLKLIGMVSVQWGSFEFYFDKLLESLIVGTGRTEPGWERRQFKKRKALFGDLIEELYGESKPEAVAAFKAVLAEAADIQWRRNVIVHGCLGITIAAKSSMASFRAESFYKGKPVTIQLDKATLDPLWHRIAHLNGALKQAFSLVGTIDEGNWPTLPDRSLLQIPEGTDRQIFPNLGMP